MALLVCKFGGTSVGTPERIQNVAARIAREVEAGHRVVVVVSAMSGETDRLIGLSQAVSSKQVPREMDVLLSTGEQVTIALLAMALVERGVAARSFTGAPPSAVTLARTVARSARTSSTSSVETLGASAGGGFSERHRTENPLFKSCAHRESLSLS